MKNNPPAFPRPHSNDHPGGEGMTLLDWFAGMALQGFIACATHRAENEDADEAGLARAAYNVAREMILARDQLHSPPPEETT